MSGHRLHHVGAAAAALLAQLEAHAALHVAPAQRQERDEARHQVLMDEAGVEETACRRERERDELRSMQRLGPNVFIVEVFGTRTDP